MNSEFSAEEEAMRLASNSKKDVNIGNEEALPKEPRIENEKHGDEKNGVEENGFHENGAISNGVNGSREVTPPSVEKGDLEAMEKEKSEEGSDSSTR